MNYSELNLDSNLKRGISEAGYVLCTPVQQEVLSVSLEDKVDLYVQSQTGTGKTAAYLICLIQHLLCLKAEEKNNALIMVPTRELAVQVEQEAEKLSKFTDLKIASFYGGVGYEKQIEKLKSGVDIIIGTPGRVIDLNGSKKMDLSRTAFLVVDEADRMFDMGFYPDLRKLLKVLPPSENRATMLFSATLNSYVKNLAWEYTKDAKEITIDSENITVDEIDQELIHVASEDKVKLLTGILSREKPESVMIFCNTKKMCEVLSKRLSMNGFDCAFIIGDLPQTRRLKIMGDFKQGKIRILVATDVAARGIDVSDLAMVVNYDLPNESENYVHRIGRTARAGKSGKAYSFCSEQDVYSLVPIERYIENRIPSRVAEAGDFADDKSEGVFIKVNDWKEDSRDEKQNRGFRSKRAGRKDSLSRQGGKRSSLGEEKSNARRGKNGGSKGAKKKIAAEEKLPSLANEEELSALSSLSSEERMKFYKARYAERKNQAKNADFSGALKQKNQGGKTNVKDSASKENTRRNQAAFAGGKNQKQTQGKADFSGAEKKKTLRGGEAKKGFLSKIKSLFFKKNDAGSEK